MQRQVIWLFCRYPLLHGPNARFNLPREKMILHADRGCCHRSVMDDVGHEFRYDALFYQLACKPGPAAALGIGHWCKYCTAVANLDIDERDQGISASSKRISTWGERNFLQFLCWENEPGHLCRIKYNGLTGKYEANFPEPESILVAVLRRNEFREAD